MRAISNQTYPPLHPLSAQHPRLTLSADEFSTAYARESGVVEFKTGFSARAIQESVVAFSNAVGGVLLIGVADDGLLVGRELTQSLEESIHQAIAEIRNPGQYELHELNVEGKSAVAVVVHARVEGFAQTSSGRILVRQGPRNQALFDVDLLAFLQQRRLDRFELQSAAIPLTGASSELVFRLESELEWSQNETNDRLSELQLITPDRELTIAGSLYLLPDPAERIGKALIEVLRFPEEGADYDKRLEVRGPLDQQVSAGTTAVLDELGTELVVLGAERHELPRIPPVVIREAIANAVAHRSYEADRSAVRIEIRPDAVKVTSPGPLPVPVTERNIREAQAPRNLAVIRVLRRLRLAEDAGRGIDVMQDAMRAEMLEPPRFHDTGHSVEVTLPIRSPVTPAERAWVRELERRGEILPSDRILLVHAARGEVLSNKLARDLSGMDRIEATRSLQRLRRAGFLRQEGERGGATYILSGSLGAPAGLRMSDAELKTTIRKLGREGPITNSLVRGRLGIDRNEAVRLLSELVKEGRLERRGERRGSHYVLLT